MLQDVMPESNVIDVGAMLERDVGDEEIMLENNVREVRDDTLRFVLAGISIICAVKVEVQVLNTHVYQTVET